MKLTLSQIGSDSVLARTIFAQQEDIINAITKSLLDGEAVYDMKLTINGIKLDPLAFYNRIEENFEEVVTREASKMVYEKFGDQSRKLTNMLMQLEEDLKDKACEIFGVKFAEED